MTINMCTICDSYKHGKIDGKEALKKISDAIKVEMDPNHIGKLTKHMFEMSEMILSKEVPETKVDKEAEEAFWKATHPEED